MIMQDSERHELVLQIFSKYRLDVDPNDPIFGALMIVAQAIIIDDEQRLEQLESRFGLIIDEFATQLEADKAAALAEFNHFSTGQLTKLEKRMRQLLDDGSVAQNALLAKSEHLSRQDGGYVLSVTALLLIWCTFLTSFVSASVLFLFLLGGF